MQKVEIYTSPFCGFCVAAKRLLKKRGVAFTEIDISRDVEQKQIMMGRSNGGHTVPQIFIGDTHVGGCDQLFDLHGRGKLDALLAG